MRVLTIFILACVISQLGPFRAPSQAAPEQDKTYFLVDASLSVVEELDESKTTLKVALQTLEHDQSGMIVFFGHDSGREVSFSCADDVQLTDPVLGAPGSTQYPKLGKPDDRTSIGKAIQALLQEIDERSKVTLITDGAEECDSDFQAIRREHPTIEFAVFQIGSKPNSALDVLELRSESEVYKTGLLRPSVTIQGPFITIEGGDTAKSRFWKDAIWLEKYLWLLCYIGLCSSAYMLSQSYKKMTERVSQSIQEWELFNRAQADPESVTPHSSTLDLPKHVSAKSFEVAGRPYRERSCWTLGFAVLLGLPLAILDDVETQVIGFAAIILTLLAIAVWIASKLVRRTDAQNHSRTKAERSISNFERTAYIVGLLLAAILVFLYVDFDQARDAAWVPLSSGLSAALTILASTPFLFTGSRWWAYQQERHSYYLVSDGATRDRIRRQEEAKRKIEAEWNDLRSRISSITSKNPLRYLTQIRMRTNQAQVFQTRLNTIYERLKDLASEAGGAVPSEEAIERYRLVLKSNRLREMISAVLSFATNIPTEERQQFEALLDALSERKSDRAIRAAMNNLVRVVDGDNRDSLG